MVRWCDAFTDLNKFELSLGQLENDLIFFFFLAYFIFLLLVHHQIELIIKMQIISE